MKGIQQFRKNKHGFLLVDAMIGVLEGTDGSWKEIITPFYK